jgi:hypothetical protein
VFDMKLLGCRNVQARPEARTARSERMWYRATPFRSPLGAAELDRRTTLGARASHLGRRLFQLLVAAQEEHTPNAFQRAAQALRSIEVADCKVDARRPGRGLRFASNERTHGVTAARQRAHDRSARVSRRTRREEQAANL